MRVTATKCLKGKRHRWKDIDMTNHYGSTDYTSWCKICGSITEFYKNEKMKKRERCYDDDGIYIEIPGYLI